MVERIITLTSEEAAEIAGCSKVTIESYARQGLIAGICMGKWRFPVVSFEADLNRLAQEGVKERSKSQKKAVDFVLFAGGKKIKKDKPPDLSAAS